MDRATRSPHLASHDASNGRPEAPDSTAPPARNKTDLVKVGKNAIASAVALGGCFGTMTALNHAVRATPAMPTPVRIVAGLLPSVSVFATPWVEDGVRQTVATSATLPVRPSLAHDAVASVSLFAFNVACARSAYVPKFPPATPAGMAAGVLQCTMASLIAGGASEITAQWMNASERPRKQAAETPPPMDNTDKAMGRVISQVPAAALQTGIALSGKPLPPQRALLPLGVVTGGWAFRRQLAPPLDLTFPLPPEGWTPG
jgi:hypothetical protein